MDSIDNAGPALLAALDETLPGWRTMERGAFDAWRRGLEGRALSRVRRAVASRVFGRPFRDSRQLEAFVERRPHGEDGDRNAMNAAMLPLWGEGRDSFFLNEHFLEHEGTWSFPTLRAYDEAVHAYQEKCRAEADDGAREPEEYRGRMLWDWARWIEDGEIAYGTLSVAASRLAAEIDDLAGDLVEAAFPREARMLADSLGADLDPSEIARWRAASRMRWNEAARLLRESWLPHFAADGAWAIVEDNEVEGERSYSVTFSGPEALERVRPLFFVTDLRALPDGSARYETFAAGERESFADWMRATIERVEAADPAKLEALAAPGTR